jgi:hypothetical protein
MASTQGAVRPGLFGVAALALAAGSSVSASPFQDLSRRDFGVSGKDLVYQGEICGCPLAVPAFPLLGQRWWPARGSRVMQHGSPRFTCFFAIKPGARRGCPPLFSLLVRARRERPFS